MFVKISHRLLRRQRKLQAEKAKIERREIKADYRI